MNQTRETTEDLGLNSLRKSYEMHVQTIPFELVEACYRAEKRLQYNLDETTAMSEVRNIVLRHVEDLITDMPKEGK